MAEVFVSFIHEELTVASAVQRFINSHLNEPDAVYMSADQWQVFAGEQWLERIVSELRRAKVVVSLLSPKSVVRPWVNFEAGAAYIQEKTALIPVCFGGMTKGSLPKPYSGLQAVNLEDYNDQYYLLRSVFHYLNRLTPIPPPPPHLLVTFPPSGNDAVSKMGEPYRMLKYALDTYEIEQREKGEAT